MYKTHFWSLKSDTIIGWNAAAAAIYYTISVWHENIIIFLYHTVMKNSKKKNTIIII